MFTLANQVVLDLEYATESTKIRRKYQLLHSEDNVVMNNIMNVRFESVQYSLYNLFFRNTLTEG